MYIHLYVTPRNRILLKKVTVPQLGMIFPAFYGSLRFITVFTKARHLFLFWVRSVHSTPFKPTSSRSFSILSSHWSLSLPSSFFPWTFPAKTLYAPLLSPIYHMPRSFHPSFGDPNNIWWRLRIMKLLIIQSSPVRCYLVHVYMKLSLSLVKKGCGVPASTQVAALCLKVCRLQDDVH